MNDKWVKYKHNFSSGHDKQWSWALFCNGEDRDDIAYSLCKIAISRGVTFHVVKDRNVPAGIWAREILREEEAARNHASKAKRLRRKMKNALAIDRLNLPACIKALKRKEKIHRNKEERKWAKRFELQKRRLKRTATKNLMKGKPKAWEKAKKLAKAKSKSKAARVMASKKVS